MENGQHRLVSAALRLPSGPSGRPLRRAAAIVDGVHMDGDLPIVPVEFGEVVDGEAFIEIDPEKRRPSRIVLSRDVRDAGWSLIHEIGHLLDFSAIGAPGRYESATLAQFAAWRDAVDASEACRKLRALSGREVHPYRLRALARLLYYEEIWARAYAQYIATRSRDPALLQHLSWRQHLASGS